MKVVAIIQARMTSSRLPGKVLMDLAGEPMLARVFERTRRARTVDDVIVATSNLVSDDGIVQLCAERDWPCFRGSQKDVLGRYSLAARAFDAEAVVRVTSDCPLIDPRLIDEHVERLCSRWTEVDFVTNMVRQSFPLGLAVEAMPFDVLARMERMSQTDYLREHVTTLAYERPELFQIDHVLYPNDLSALRWTVDTAADLNFVRLIFKHFGRDSFLWEDVLPVLKEHPDWSETNQSILKGPSRDFARS
jgi:spore coat polysaccharide biosynthesis protein SpsF